jgi:hypothetical protein
MSAVVRSPVRKKSKVGAAHAAEEAAHAAEEAAHIAPAEQAQFDILVPNISIFVKICKAVADSVGDFLSFTFTGREIVLKQFGPGKCTLVKFRYPCESKEGKKELPEQREPKREPVFVVKGTFLKALEGALDMSPEEVRFRTVLDGIEILSIACGGGTNDFVHSVSSEEEPVIKDIEYTRTVTIEKTAWMSMCKKAKDEKELTIMLVEKEKQDYIVFKTHDQSQTVFECGGDEQKGPERSAKDRAKKMEALIQHEWGSEEVKYTGVFSPDHISRLLKGLNGKVSCQFPAKNDDNPIRFTYNWGMRGVEFQYIVAEKIGDYD